MRNKATILQDLGLTGDYNPHAGLSGDLKDVLLIEILIDIRDQIPVLSTLISRLLVERSPDP